MIDHLLVVLPVFNYTLYAVCGASELRMDGGARVNPDDNDGNDDHWLTTFRCHL